MKKPFLVFSLLTLLLIMPIQNASANWIDDRLEEAQKFVEQETQVPESVKKIQDMNSMIEKLPKIIQYYQEDALEISLLTQIGNDVIEFQIKYPEEFMILLEWFPELNNILDLYFTHQESHLLESVEPMEDMHIVEYVSDISQPLQYIGYNKMLTKYVNAEKITEFDSKEELSFEISRDLLGHISTYDEQTGEEITLEQHVEMTLKKYPILANSDLIDDPYGTVFKLYVDSDYIFLIPIIPISENQSISIKEFCQLQIDEKKCDMLIRLGTMAHMAIKKDPNLALETVQVLLIIASEINDETNAGYDSELMIAKHFVDKTPEELLNEKIFRLSNGQYVSLNYLSNIDCDNVNVSIAEKLISEYTTVNKTPEHIKIELKEFIQILQEIKEGECTLLITQQ